MQTFGKLLGLTSEDHRRSATNFYIKLAVLSGVPLALYWRSKNRGSKPLAGATNVLETDFDAFLYKMGSSPTGLTAGGQAKASERGKVRQLRNRLQHSVL
jgi:hypothetical protein